MAHASVELPEGMTPLSPHLICAGAADAMDFYQKAFGATLMMKLEAPDGKIMHGALSINGGSVMLVDENAEYGMLGPKAVGGTPVSIHLVVDDAQAWQDRAVAAGATVRMPVQKQFWGDLYGTIEDPWGHVWSVATPMREPMSEGELREAMKTAQPM